MGYAIGFCVCSDDNIYGGILETRVNPDTCGRAHLIRIRYVCSLLRRGFKRARGGSWEGGRKRSEASFHLPRDPRTHHSLPQSSNIFIALANSSPPPPENPREPLRRRELRVDAQSFKLAKKIPDLKIF